MTVQMETVIVILLLSCMLVGMLILILRKFYNENRVLRDELAKKQARAAQIGRNSALGDIYQFIGDFAILPEYDELVLLSTTSRQPSLDVIGIKEDRMDFIELKKKGARISPSENKIRRIIENKNVRYVVKDVEIPAGVSVVERQLPELRR